ITLPAHFPDSLATALEAVVVAGAAALLARGQGLARSVVRSPGITAAAAVVAGALTLGGVLSQGGALGSSPPRHGTGGTRPSAPNSPLVPAGTASARRSCAVRPVPGNPL